MAKKKTTPGRAKPSASKPAPAKRTAKAGLPRTPGAPKGPKSSAPKPPAEIGSVRHTDKRKNIPTEELRDFLKDDGSPKTLLYPRNPDLDPQLVWRGKDEQDRAPDG